MNLRESAAVVMGSMLAAMSSASLCALLVALFDVGTLRVSPDATLHVALGQASGIVMFMLLLAILVVAGAIVGAVLGVVNAISASFIGTFTERWQVSLLFVPMCIAALVLWSAGIGGGDAKLLLLISAAAGAGSYFLAPILLERAQ